MKRDVMLIFERGGAGRRAAALPNSGVPGCEPPPARMLRRHPPALPEVAEVELVRHYTALARRSHGVDDGFYPLGSCTMKYSPRRNERAAEMFSGLHPFQDERTAQGALESALAPGTEPVRAHRHGRVHAAAGGGRPRGALGADAHARLARA